jgi:hypothetical protein
MIRNGKSIYFIRPLIPKESGNKNQKKKANLHLRFAPIHKSLSFNTSSDNI